jgi:hypothetical protein
MLGDSPRPARYAGMRPRRKILAVIAFAGPMAVSPDRSVTATCCWLRSR